jgi:hypothetical protein
VRHPSRRDAVRVASIPAGHPYVVGLGLAAAGAVLLPDPPVPGAPSGRWWPPVMLDPEWLTAHATEFDLMHVHFGVESVSLVSLGRVLDALRRAGRPLVLTVHDLTHPQLEDQSHHLAQLDLLIPASDALITLTPGAAREIDARWGRSVHVIGHPAMRWPPSPPPARPSVASPDPRAAPVIGIHLRDLRPGVDGPGSVAVLAGALTSLRAGGVAVRGQVWLHDHVRDTAASLEVQRQCAESEWIDLVQAPRPDDRGLEAQLAGLAVSVLPYRHGTHSGWLELCYDLGVPVAGPAFGHFADQHPDPGVYRSFAPADPADPASLADAVAGLLSLPEAVPGSPARADAVTARGLERRRAQPAIAAAHVALYRALLDERPGGTDPARRVALPPCRPCRHAGLT